MLCIARAWQPAGRKQEPSVGDIWPVHQKPGPDTHLCRLAGSCQERGEGSVQGTNGGRQGCHDRPRGDSPEPGCPFPLAAG